MWFKIFLKKKKTIKNILVLLDLTLNCTQCHDCWRTGRHLARRENKINVKAQFRAYRLELRT